MAVCEQITLTADPGDCIIEGWVSMDYGAWLQVVGGTASCWWNGEAMGIGDTPPDGVLTFEEDEKFTVFTREELRLMRCITADAGLLNVMPRPSRQPDWP